jgi:hypothetical protein
MSWGLGPGHFHQANRGREEDFGFGFSEVFFLKTLDFQS